MADPKTVVLVDQNGNDFNASHPAEITNLVFGAGYRFKEKGMTAEKAAALLAEKGPAAEAIAAQTPTVTPTGGGGK